MDDAIGTSKPENPARYTMRLNADGTVHMRLNCNRANGTWKADAAPGGSSGSFTFGPLAATRALCPPPSLDEQVTRQAQFIRSYLLKDGKLHLSLMADGGIWTWEPHTGEPFETTPDPRLEAAILQASPSYTKEMVDAGGGAKAWYVYGRVDLNGDGRDEVLAYLLGPFFCGTGGCTLLLFTESGNGYSLVNEFPTSRLPITVSSTKTGGWNDIIRPESGGGTKPSYSTGTPSTASGTCAAAARRGRRRLRAGSISPGKSTSRRRSRSNRGSRVRGDWRVGRRAVTPPRLTLSRRATASGGRAWFDKLTTP